MTGKPSLKCLTAFLLLLLANSYLFAQEKIVTGKVKDPQGNPLPGVNVNVWGSRQSVTADVTGSFSIPVPSDNSTLVFSFVGFLQKEVKVGDQTDLQVTMAYDNADLDQVVVVGYGTQRRRDLTGSVYSVKPGQITQTPTFNALEALQGRVPGLDITRSSGEAGAPVNITVRGNRSISQTSAQKQPLYIIDGFQGGDITDLNPNDIESIEVLRDASATAIYGWMGANGVIIVTTKKGKDRPRVSYTGYYGVNGYVSFPKPRIGDDYVKLRKEAYRTANNEQLPASDEILFASGPERDAFNKGQWVDWVDLLTRNGTQQSHTASIQSGGDKTKVFFSTGYYKEEGALRGNDMTRYNARLNYDQRISNVFKAGLLTQITYQKANVRTDPYQEALSTIPLGTPYDSLGNIRPVALDQSNAVNPLSDERPLAFKDNRIRTNLVANGYIEITPINGLSLRSNLGTSITFSKVGYFADSLTVANFNRNPKWARQETNFNRFFNWDNVLTYTRKISDHSLTLTALTSFTRLDNEGLTYNAVRQIVNSQYDYALQNGTWHTGAGTSNPSGSEYVKATTFSYAGRFNYSYKGKYLLTASLRADGASRLAPGNKWDYFPSAAIGWNIHQEGFMSNAYFINNLKVRASYGVTGNANIDPYGTQNVLFANYGLTFNGNTNAPYYNFADIVGNPHLSWEKTATTNLALDFAFLKSRLFGTFELYKQNTTGILYKRRLPYSSGRVEVWENICETENKGIELALSSVNVSTQDFKWTTTLTYTSTREKITKLVDDKDVLAQERNSLFQGHPYNSWFTYTKLGIWQANEADKAGALKWGTANGNSFKPGDIKLADLDNNGIIDDKDKGPIGAPVPKWYGGLQNTFNYKGFELNIYLYARWGQIIDAEFLGRYSPSGTGVTSNGPQFDYWTPENSTNDFPRPDARITSFNNIPGYQAVNFIDGSFFKVKTVTFAYTLPGSASRHLYAEKIRIYATGNNIFTKAKHHLLKNYDPERGGASDSPLTRQVVVGVNVDF